MNQLIALLLPSIIGLKVYNRISKTQDKLENKIERYLTYVLFINLFVYTITIYLFKQPNIVFTYEFTVKYILLSLVIAVIVPIFERIIKCNLDIGVIVEKNEEEN